MYVFGRNVAKQLLDDNRKINKVYVQEGFREKELLISLEKKKIPVSYLSKIDMDKLSEGHHQGIILDIEDYNFFTLDTILNDTNEKLFIVILDHLEDPHNFGAIIRTCEASGVDYIIVPKDRSVSVNATVMKTSAGAVSNVKIVTVTNLVEAIKKLKKKGVWIVGTDMENATDFRHVDFNIPVAIVVGNEGTGISNLVSKNCDFIAKIPMYGKVNSLNASVATAIMIYEVLRQRGK